MTAYAARRRTLLGTLTGTVLEIGAGAGANFADFRSDIKWLGLDPDPGRSRKLAATAAAYGQRAPVITAPAERIPLADASADAVVATAVLCSVADQDQVLAEVRRVLRPSGAFVFFEHVPAPAGTWSYRLQRCWAPVSRRLDGCDPGRQTWRAIEAAGFREVLARWYTRRPGFSLYNPVLGGIAYV
jgi:ubiquinone/menaquinone biosynthesis C-methylase UbiE